MKQLPESPSSSRFPQPACWSRMLLSMSFICMGILSQAVGQTYFNLTASNYTEDFSTINAPWPALTIHGNASSNSFSGLAIDVTGAIPSATRITTSTTSSFATGGTAGVQIGTGNLQLLSAGSTANSSSTGVDLNLNFTGRMSGNLSFDVATVFNSTGDRTGALKVYVSADGTTWTEITGSNLPYEATNNLAGSASINVAIPPVVNGNSQVKLRFYYHNFGTGALGSRPKISIDNVVVTSVSDGMADTTSPLVSTLSPTNGATSILRDTQVVATFNELVQAGTGTILLRKIAGAIPVSATIVISGSTLTIDPTANLDYNTAYEVVIPPGAMKDMANNPFGGTPASTTWTFTTVAQDLTPPALVSFTPDGSGVASTLTLAMTFSEDIHPAGGDIVLKNSSGTTIQTIAANALTPGFSVSGSVVTLTLAAPLDYGVSYYVQIAGDAFMDHSENPYPGILAADTTTWSFTTVSLPVLAAVPYTQAFAAYDGVHPAGWTAISDAVPPIHHFVGAWGTQLSTAGFLGSTAPDPGVLGYRHTGSTGNLTVTLRLVNGTGAPLTSLNIAYQGRVNDIEETRSPEWVVSVNDSPAIPELGYSTSGNIDSDLAATVTGLNIPIGAEFSIRWVSNRGEAAGSAKQIGIGAVSVSASSSSYHYASWAADNNAAGGANGDHDHDGVKNSLEYFMGATGASFTANPSLVGGKITWPKAAGFVGAYTIQTSPDLSTWTNKSSTLVGNTVEFTPTGPAPIFVRLQVITPP